MGCMKVITSSLSVISVSDYTGYDTYQPVTSQMDFAHYTDDPVNLAVDLVNTFSWHSGTDTLGSLEDLEAFVSDAIADWAGDLPNSRPRDLGRVRLLRQRLRSAFEAGGPNEAADAINTILEDSGATPYLSVHGGTPHMHFESQAGSLADWLGVVTAMGLATVIADRGFERFGICEADDCADAYVDTSRNRSRRHCSSTCRTRENVAAHRERQRSEP